MDSEKFEYPMSMEEANMLLKGMDENSKTYYQLEKLDNGEIIMVKCKRDD